SFNSLMVSLLRRSFFPKVFFCSTVLLSLAIFSLWLLPVGPEPALTLVFTFMAFPFFLNIFRGCVPRCFRDYSEESYKSPHVLVVILRRIKNHKDTKDTKNIKNLCALCVFVVKRNTCKTPVE